MLVCSQENEAGTLLELNSSWLDTTTCFGFVGVIYKKKSFMFMPNSDCFLEACRTF